MRTRPLAALAAAALCTGAHATWSILLVDTRTGEIALGSATCLANFDLQANTPTLLTGTGASTAQSFVDSTGANRVFIRDQLSRGTSPASILQLLATFDAGHQTRQYGMVDADGHAAAFTGTGAGQWAGGNTGEFTYTFHGQVGSISYAVQGNVLTGAPVVAAAVQAITTTQGDLSAKLMAGMQAARSMGGDGRCSCSPNNPQGCGSPPPNFTKSAHIGYMIVARAGDRDGCDGVYRSNGAGFLALADFSGHGTPDIATASTQGAVGLLLNTTNPGAAFPTFTLPGAGYGTGVQALAAADMDRDGWPDLVVATGTSARIGIHRNLIGRFAPRVEIPIPASTFVLAAGDLNNDQATDVVTVSQTGAVFSLLNNGAGGLTPSTSGALPGNQREIRLGRTIPGGNLDLFAVPSAAGNLQVLLGDGAGGFTPGPQGAVGGPALALDVGDLDNDGDDDAVVGLASSLIVLRNTGGAFAPTSYPLSLSPQKLLLADVNLDGLRDIVFLSGTRFAVMLNRPGQPFEAPRTYFKGYGLTNLAAADLDVDGDPDLAITTSSGTILAVQNLGNAAGQGAGTFNDGQGCATGNYYLDLNVAFQATTAPDPVIQLQQQFDAWRTAQIGKPDAVHSTIQLSPAIIPPNTSGSITITLRDWQDTPVSTPATVTIALAPGSPALLSIGPVTPQGSGVYSATLTAGPTPGAQPLRITADDGVRPVTLMPDPTVTIAAPLGGGTRPASAGARPRP